jgi:RHS repeat-associated protein
VTTRYQTDAGALNRSDGSGQPDLSWAGMSGVANDVVLTQTETQYDPAGNPVLVTSRQRFHDAATLNQSSPPVQATGPLGNPATPPQTGAAARVYYSASWYDASNRVVAQADYGTNGSTPIVTQPAQPQRTDQPVQLGTVLLTEYGYNAAGWVGSVTDPRGLVTQTSYDSQHRVTRTVANYAGDGTPNNSFNQTTAFTWDGDDHVLTQTAVLPAGATQTTTYVYGVSGLINSNDLLASVVYPDNGQPHTESYSYNALGETVGMTDRNGTSHAYSYDVLGRQTSDAVTIPAGSSVDDAIQRIQTAYDGQGNAYLFTSYHGDGSVANQVLRQYNGLGQLTAEYQAHAGAVLLGGANPTPAVQYAYSQMQNSASQYANHSRLLRMTYPNGRVVYDTYASGLDDTISRLTALSDNADGTGVLEAYAYLGLDTVVQRTRPQPGEQLTYVRLPGEPAGDAGDQYTGLDRFGRVVDQRWVPTGGGTPLDRFQYGYDADGNALYRANLVTEGLVTPLPFDELYHRTTAGSGYDGLNRLTDFSRGTLNASHDGLVGSATRTQSWQLDALGNWLTVASTPGGPTQARTHNAQNQISALSGAGTPGYDANGNTTTDETGNGYVYDAWNRLVGVSTPGGGTASYAYDGLGRRIVENAGTARDLFYSSSWQVVEEQAGGVTQTQYVWSPVYVDALVERDSGGTRLYVQQDANWNVTSVANVAGAVQERYVYDPYGKPTFLDPNWNPVSGGTSAVNWVYLHQGGRLDGLSGLYLFRNRDFSPSLGRWMEQDPAGYVDGMSRYQYNASNPVVYVDPAGLCPCGGGGGRGGQPSNWTRLHGAIRTFEAVTMIVAGASMAISTSPTGFGILFGAAMAAKGVDNLFAGVDEFSNGRARRTLSHWALEKAFGSCEAADHAEHLIDAVFIATVISKWPEADFARGNCFPAGTPVATERGLVPIEEVESGERVWSFDFRAGRWVLCRVALVHETPFEGEVLTLVFEDGTSLEVTVDHPIWVIEGEGLASRPQLHFRDACEDSGLSLPGRWVHSQALRVGDQLYGQGQRCVRIRAIQSRQDSLPVYNLSVLGLPYYAVGSVGILVHNTESSSPRISTGDRFPSRDSTGKIHTHGSKLPDSVPRDWKPGEIQDAIEEVSGSIATRKAEQAARQPSPEDILYEKVKDLPGRARGHDQRIVEEERWLRQLVERLRALLG